MMREMKEDKGGGDPLNRIMISTHHIKTKLIPQKKKKRDCVKVDEGDPSVETVYLIAVGNEENLMHPVDFRYIDPFNSWQCRTIFFNSQQIKHDIEESWDDLLETEAKGKEVEERTQAMGKEVEEQTEKEQDAWKSIAKHQVLDKFKKPKMLKVVKGITLKPAKQDNLLEFTAHSRDKKALQNSLEQNDHFLDRCRQWHERGQCETLLKDIKATFFCESSLPCSFKFATSRLKHQILPRPNQLGVQQKLALLYHNDAHIRFSHKDAAVGLIEEEDVVAHLKAKVGQLETQ